MRFPFTLCSEGLFPFGRARLRASAIGAASVSLAAFWSCSSGHSGGASQVAPLSDASVAPDGAAGSSVTTLGGNGPSLNVDGSVATAGSDASGGNTGDASATKIVTSLPAGFTQTDLGGYQLGAPLGAGDAGADASAPDAGDGGPAPAANGNCGNVLVGVVRDFKGATLPGGHPDFEAEFNGSDVTPNLVEAALGSDQKPTYSSQCEVGVAISPTCPFGPQTTTQANFDQWYRDTPGVNEPYVISLYLAPQPGGLFTFQSLEYFPLDGAGFADTALADDGQMHNFSFTTEIHTQFAYAGGETFQFEGDDDVWVFINNRLAVDLGGLHKKALGSVSLDTSAAALGIQTGKVYTLDLFHAERHTNQSTFRIDTNLSFVNCGTVLPPVVIK